MLIKLLKYDLKYMTKNMMIFYVLSLFFAITTRILYAVNETTFLNILAKISLSCLIAMLVNIIFNTTIRSWVRFKDSLYKDEGYLTHTLPVTKEQIYGARFLEMIIFTLVGFAVIALSLFISFYTNERIEFLKTLLDSFANGLQMSSLTFVSVILAIFFLEIVNATQAGFFGIITGFKQNDNKILCSFVFGFVFYMISQGIFSVMIFLVGLLNEDILNIFTSNAAISGDVLKLLIVLSIAIYVFLICIGSMLCTWIFKKGVNIE